MNFGQNFNIFMKKKLRRFCFVKRIKIGQFEAESAKFLDFKPLERQLSAIFEGATHTSESAGRHGTFFGVPQVSEGAKVAPKRTIWQHCGNW